MASTTVEKTTADERIPELLASQGIFKEFLSRYLSNYDEIVEYNEGVLREKNSEWNSYKILDKARELARPTDGKSANETIKGALVEWEKLASEVNAAKQHLIQVAAKELGIEYNSGSERDPEKEAPLREMHKTNINIGKQLTEMVKMTVDPKLQDTLTDFLKTYKMPAVGRNQTHDFLAEETDKTPKYRLRITASREETGEELFTEDGITKAVGATAKFYERGKGLKADSFRKAWESAGNSMGNTVQNSVSFTDNGLIFTLTAK